MEMATASEAAEKPSTRIRVGLQAYRKSESGFGFKTAPSNLRIEIEERIETAFQLFLDLILAAFENVHGHVGLAAVFKLEGRVPHFRDFLGRQQPQSIHKC